MIILEFPGENVIFAIFSEQGWDESAIMRSTHSYGAGEWVRKKACEHGVIDNGDCLDVMPAVIVIKQKNFLLNIMFFA